MIKIQAGIAECVVSATIFPDGTSQVWKLPNWVFEARTVTVMWRFEAERELVDLMSLSKLLKNNGLATSLYVPFLPYARQDKPLANDSTFNLRVLADVINLCNFDKVTTMDAHNPVAAEMLIHNFVNLSASDLHTEVISTVKPDVMVFPDLGAQQRYNISYPRRIIAYKTRNQSTGQITGHEFSYRDEKEGITRQIADLSHVLRPGDKLLIVDDICDGGATFTGLATKLRTLQDSLQIDLFVTHGIFSKGRQVLHDNGINNIYTTNSLLKNTEGYEV